MYISRIHIQNFRNFMDLDMKLGPTSVIVGENKVGKSNLLHALRLVLDPSLPDSSRRLRAEDFWDGLPNPLSGNVIRVAIEISGFDTSIDAKAVLADYIVSLNPTVARLTYEFRPRPSVGSNSSPLAEQDYEFVIYGGTDQKNRVGSDVRQWISLLVLPALRDAESDIRNWRRSPLRPLLERLSIDPSRLNAIAESLGKVSEDLLKEKAVGDLAKGITNRIQQMVGPALREDTALGFASANPDQLLRSVRLFIDGSRSRPLADASLGSANIIFLALLLQDLEERVQGKEAVSHVLAIEEPEAHLHPHVQRSVFRYFLRQGSPLIVTTHSPHLASVTPLESLVVLRNTGNNGTQAFSAHALALTEQAKADLQRYLDVSRAEMLFAKGVILVEGAAELFLVPAIAASLRDDAGEPIELDRYGITVCSVHGTDFAPYWRVIGVEGFNLPCVAITDGDWVVHESEVRYRGLERGASLLSGTTATQIKAALKKGEWREARALLGEHFIYVGEKTLELDLMPQLSTAMKQSYREIRGSGQGADNFATLVDSAIAGDSAAERRVLERIEDIGKGRFAQRLADKVSVGGIERPLYIEAAIRTILGKVKSLWT